MQRCIPQINSCQAKEITYRKIVGTRWDEVQQLHSVPLGSSLQNPSLWALVPLSHLSQESPLALPGLAKLGVSKHQSKANEGEGFCCIQCPRRG